MEQFCMQAADRRRRLVERGLPGCTGGKRYDGNTDVDDIGSDCDGHVSISDEKHEFIHNRQKRTLFSNNWLIVQDPVQCNFQI